MEEFYEIYIEFEAIIEIYCEGDYVELEEELRFLGYTYFDEEEIEWWD